ncbi:MAG: hypothetical protein JXA43_02295 [Candidatus Diapherotrites archaeon]|nr:hypothetical protein [Candidatus Diapherotrites archaeon]
MPKINLLFFLMVVLAAISVVVLQFNTFMSSDLFERARVSYYISEMSRLPTHNQALGGTVPYTYPLLFDVFSASLMQVTGLEALTIWQGFSMFLSVGFFMVAYSLAKKFVPDWKYAALAGMFTVFAPRLFRLIAIPIPETFGLFLILLTLLLLLEDRYKLASVSAAALVLMHTRSSINFIPILLIFIVFAYSYKNSFDYKKVLKFLSFPVFAAVVFWLPKLLFLQRLSFVENPFVLGFQPFNVVGYSLLLSLVAVPFVYKDKKIRPITIWFVFYFAILFMSLVFGNTMFAYREFTFAIFPAAVLAAIVLKKISKSYFFRPLIIVFLLIVIFNAVSLGVNYAPPASDADIAAAVYHRSIEPARIMSGFVSGYYIPWYSLNSVVVGAYMEGLPNANQRISDTRDFFESENPEEAAYILSRNNVDYVYLSQFELYGLYSQLFKEEKMSSRYFSKIQTSNLNETYRVE